MILIEYQNTKISAHSALSKQVPIRTLQFSNTSCADNCSVCNLSVAQLEVTAIKKVLIGWSNNSHNYWWWIKASVYIANMRPVILINGNQASGYYLDNATNPIGAYFEVHSRSYT